MSSKPKVLVAMSGGVDSSVAAALLLREGYDIVGCFMRLGSPGETVGELLPDQSCEANAPAHINAPAKNGVKIGHQGCCSILDAADARLVAAKLGIPLYVCNFKKEFGRIIDYFADAYASGATPNPCVRCNDWLKFGKLHDYAQQVGASFVASGHYARVQGGQLLRAVDHKKDQSYVLFGAPRERLRSMLLPIGEFEKPRVRELAKELNLPVFDKPDSQEICFVPDNDYAGLVSRLRPQLSVEGRVLDTSGNVLGTHQGHHHFTIGQRRGVSIAMGKRVYVVSKDPKGNTVTLGEEADLLCPSCDVGEANWLGDVQTEQRVLAKFRSNSPPVPATLTLLESGDAPTPSGRFGRFRVEFDQPATAVAKGQAMVLYDASKPDLVLGGGWIERVDRFPGT